MNLEDFLTLGTLYCLISATRGNIVRIDSATDDTIRVSLTVAIRFTDASVNRYTPSPQAAGWTNGWTDRGNSIVTLSSCLMSRDEYVFQSQTKIKNDVQTGFETFQRDLFSRAGFHVACGWWLMQAVIQQHRSKLPTPVDRQLTLKHRETHGCVVSTVATDALVLKHQAISILSTD